MPKAPSTAPTTAGPKPSAPAKPDTWTPARGEAVDFYDAQRVRGGTPRRAVAYPRGEAGRVDLVVESHPWHDRETNLPAHVSALSVLCVEDAAGKAVTEAYCTPAPWSGPSGATPARPT